MEVVIDKTVLIYFGLFAVISLIIIRRPSTAMGAIVCTYGLEQWAQSQSAFFFMHSWLTNVMTGLLACYAIMIRLIRRKRGIDLVTRESFIVLGILVLSFLSLLWSINAKLTWEHYSGSLPYLIVFAVLAPMLVATWDDLRDGLLMLLAIGFSLVVLILATSRFENRTVVFETGLALADGMNKGNPLATATLAGNVAIIGWLLNFRGVGRAFKALRFVVIGVAFVLAVKSGSRGQTFLMLLVPLMYTPLSRRLKDVGSFIGMAASVVVLGTIVFYSFGALLDTGIDASRWQAGQLAEAYEGGRIQTALTLLGVWADYGPVAWILGLGASASYEPWILGIYPHIVAIEMLCELGLIGFALFCALPILTFKNISTLRANAQNDVVRRGELAAILGLFTFEFLLSFKEGSLYGSGFLLCYFTIIGRLAYTCRRESETLAQLDAGGYAMTEQDWLDAELGEDVDESAGYPSGYPREVQPA